MSLETNLIEVSCGNQTGGKYPVLNQNKGSLPSYRRKDPTIWDKSINVQRKRFVKQLTS